MLRAKLKTLIERSVAKERELVELKTKVTDLSRANLLQEEDFKRQLHDLTSRNKALTKERKRTVKERNDSKEENARLKARVGGWR
jgi:predicted  nucleic acid-binding Zn-ribbon protein